MDYSFYEKNSDLYCQNSTQHDERISDFAFQILHSAVNLGRNRLFRDSKPRGNLLIAKAVAPAHHENAAARIGKGSEQGENLLLDCFTGKGIVDLRFLRLIFLFADLFGEAFVDGPAAYFMEKQIAGYGKNVALDVTVGIDVAARIPQLQKGVLRQILRKILIVRQKREEIQRTAYVGHINTSESIHVAGDKQFYI
jgi:hypothetical protein